MERSYDIMVSNIKVPSSKAKKNQCVLIAQHSIIKRRPKLLIQWGYDFDTFVLVVFEDLKRLSSHK